MAHNFRITTGSVYVSKAGSLTGTGSITDPYQSLDQVPRFSNLVIVGAGQYTGQLKRNTNYVADGKVIINLLATTGEYTVIGATGITFVLPASGSGMVIFNEGGYNVFTNCSFIGQDNGSPNLINAGAYYFSCIFDTINVTGQSPPVTINNCLLLNSRFPSGGVYSGCYIGPNSTVAGGDASSNTNNLRGLWGGLSLADNRTALPGFQPTTINADPLFNNALRRDYTLRLTSPHLAGGIGPTYLRYAQTWYVQSTVAAGQICTPANAWLVNSADGSIINFLNLTGFSWSQQGSLYITENQNGSFVAKYRTAPIQIASVAQVLKFLPVLSGYNFNTDFPAAESNFDSNQPDPQNNNVPAVYNYASGDAGRNPHRPTINMRWSTRQTPQDGAGADWLTGANFLPFEVDAQPVWNQASGVGGGDPTFDATPANVQVVRALWIQLEYTARNNYYSR